MVERLHKGEPTGDGQHLTRVARGWVAGEDQSSAGAHRSQIGRLSWKSTSSTNRPATRRESGFRRRNDAAAPTGAVKGPESGQKLRTFAGCRSSGRREAVPVVIRSDASPGYAWTGSWLHRLGTHHRCYQRSRMRFHCSERGRLDRWATARRTALLSHRLKPAWLHHGTQRPRSAYVSASDVGTAGQRQRLWSIRLRGAVFLGHAPLQALPFAPNSGDRSSNRTIVAINSWSSPGKSEPMCFHRTSTRSRIWRAYHEASLSDGDVFFTSR